MDDEPSTPGEQPLKRGNLLFGEMGITPPPIDKVIDVCSVTFDLLKKRIMKQRHKYFPNDSKNPISVVIKKMITSKTRINFRVIMTMNVAFTTSTQDNSKYFINENARLRRELVGTKQ